MRSGTRRRGLAGVFLLCLALTACAPEVEVPRGMPDSVAVDEGEGACRLLAVEEVEVAVNRPLAGTQTSAPGDDERSDEPDSGSEEETDSTEPDAATPRDGAPPEDAPEGEPPPEEARGGETPFENAPQPDGAPPSEGQPEGGDEVTDPRTGGSGTVRPLLPGMEMCSLGSPRAGAVWGVLDGSSESRYERYTEWHADYLDSAPVEDHEGVWDPSLRTLLVWTGDEVFGITLTAVDPSLADDEDKPAYLKERARELAARALGRL